jgi:hypothetical protein
MISAFFGVKIRQLMVFAGYQSKQDFLKDFEQKFVISNAYKQLEAFYNWVFKTMDDTAL